MSQDFRASQVATTLLRIDPQTTGRVPITEIRLTNGESDVVQQGEVLYMSGNLTVRRSKSDVDSTAKSFVVCLADVSSSQVGTFARGGTVTIPFARQGGGIGWAGGNQIWVSNVVPGLLTNVKPLTSGHFEVPCGTLVESVVSGSSYLELSLVGLVIAIP